MKTESFVWVKKKFPVNIEQISAKIIEQNLQRKKKKSLRTERKEQNRTKREVKVKLSKIKANSKFILGFTSNKILFLKLKNFLR